MLEQQLAGFQNRLGPLYGVLGTRRGLWVYGALILVLTLTATIGGGSAQQLVFGDRVEDISVRTDRFSSYSYLPIVSQKIASVPSTTRPIYGVNFISSAEDQVDGQQYQNGLSTGAAWNRWPLYWFNIENSQNVFDWSRQDNTVRQDLSYGFEIDAILLVTPNI
jgi:hypothetical protein